jgi:uncharacterized membrane protein YhaH (DUF805 family)
MYPPLIVVSILGQLLEASQGEPNPVASLLILGFSLWILIDLGCLQGTVGANRLGPDPLRPELAAEAFS